MTAEHVMVSRHRRGKGPATKRQQRRIAAQAVVRRQQERDRRYAVDHSGSGQQ